jgi:hypothetical protein
MRWLIAALLLVAASGQAFGHGFAGQRFFPATLTTEDPFVADELSLPTVSTVETPEAGSTRENEISVELAKRLTPRLGLSIGQGYLSLDPADDPPAYGLTNLELGLKYQLYTDDRHEAIVSAGVEWEVGGSGRAAVGAERSSVVTPTVYFGKGLGVRAAVARPLAVTGALGLAVPTGSEGEPEVLELGLAVEYSLIYLQSKVRDVGLRGPLRRLVPLVEVSLERKLDGGEPTLGTINPGVLWSGQHLQLGVEAIIPVNRWTGRGVGVISQLHLYLDDIFPRTIGRPMIGGRP